METPPIPGNDQFVQSRFNTAHVTSQVVKLASGVTLELPGDVAVTPEGLRAHALHWEKKPPGYPEWAAQLRETALYLERNGGRAIERVDLTAEASAVEAEREQLLKQAGLNPGEFDIGPAAEHFGKSDVRAAFPAFAEARARTGEQPAPVSNSNRPTWELVKEDIDARDKVGRQRYGTPLQPGNGRDNLRDAYEEALDLVVYLRTEMAEREQRGASAAAQVMVEAIRAEARAAFMLERTRAMACARAVVMKYIRHRMPEHSSVANEVWRLIEAGGKPDPREPLPHTDDAHVQAFAFVMMDKMERSRARGRDGWQDSARCSATHLYEQFLCHVAKVTTDKSEGWEDVANFAMMLWYRAGDDENNEPFDPKNVILPGPVARAHEDGERARIVVFLKEYAKQERTSPTQPGDLVGNAEVARTLEHIANELVNNPECYREA